MASRVTPQSAPRSSVLNSWIGRSHVSTFMRCLHLLNFDLLEDWPSIDEHTFSIKSNHQNIQQRIRAVEWSLYRLFEKYSPAETKDKLKPFFPPLTPLQSVNLRAALLRSLTELKKNGTLGKEVLLRKTMLDECKGEKLEELLANFAMIVLRQTTVETLVSQNLHQYLVESPSSDDWSTFALLLSHRKALQKCLQDRELTKEHVRAQKEILQNCAEDLHLRRQALLGQIKHVSTTEEHNLTQLLRKLWSADVRWLTVLKKGGSWMSSKASDTLLSIDQQVDCDALSSRPNRPQAVLEDLHSRLLIRQERLHEKQNLYTSLRAEYTEPGPAATPPAIDHLTKLSLDMHQSLRPVILPLVPGENTATECSMLPAYAILTQNLTSELGSTDRTTRTGDHPLDRPPTSSQASHKTTQLRSEIPEESPEPATKLNAIVLSTTKTPANKDIQDAVTKDIDIDQQSSYQWSKMNASPEPIAVNMPSACGSEQQSALRNQTDQSRPEANQKPVQKISDSSPPMSKIEFRPFQDGPTSIYESRKARISALCATDKADPSQPHAAQGKLSEDLTARTRQSMAGISDIIHPKRSHIKRPKEQRSSIIYPINQFETPQSSKRLSIQSVTSKDSTPREKLFEEADYASVFRSRPRVVNSPTLSPDKPSFDIESDVEDEILYT